MTETATFNVNLDTDVYIHDELNHREVADTQEEIEQTARAIHTTSGLLQPIVLYPSDDVRLAEHGRPYELGMGYRRVKALRCLAEMTGDQNWVTSVPAIIRPKEDYKNRFINQLIENLARRDLSYMETGITFKRALDENKDLTQKELSDSIGWSEPVVSKYLLLANKLSPDLQTMALGKHFSYSHAYEIAKLDLPPEQQLDLAKIASGKTIGDFIEYCKKTYGGNEAAATNADGTPFAEAGATNGQAAQEGQAGTAEGTQPLRVFNSIKPRELQDKYIPHLEEMVKKSKGKDVVIWEARLDAAKFILNREGTKLDADLAPWEKEQQEKANAESAKKKEGTEKSKFIKTSASLCHSLIVQAAELKKVQDKIGGSLKIPECTLPIALEQIKANITESIKKAKEAKLGEGYMSEGFQITSADDLVEEVAKQYAEDEVRRAENKKKAEEKKKETDKKKEEDKKKAEEAEKAEKAEKAATAATAA